MSDGTPHTSTIQQSKTLEGTLQQPNPLLLGLPAPSDVPASTTTGEDPRDAFKLDHLGPVIVNTDGTISRISGWNKLTDLEKQRSLRLLAKRNNARMDVLRNGGAEGNEEAA